MLSVQSPSTNASKLPSVYLCPSDFLQLHPIEVAHVNSNATSEHFYAYPKEVYSTCGAEVVPSEICLAHPERELFERRARLVELELRLRPITMQYERIMSSMRYVGSAEKARERTRRYHPYAYTKSSCTPKAASVRAEGA